MIFHLACCGLEFGLNFLSREDSFCRTHSTNILRLLRYRINLGEVIQKYMYLAYNVIKKYIKIQIQVKEKYFIKNMFRKALDSPSNKISNIKLSKNSRDKKLLINPSSQSPLHAQISKSNSQYFVGMSHNNYMTLSGKGKQLKYRNGESQVEIYKNMQDKLNEIESKIEEIKANMYKKGLERKKISIERSQVLDKLRQEASQKITKIDNKQITVLPIKEKQQKKQQKIQQTNQKNDKIAYTTDVKPKIQQTEGKIQLNSNNNQLNQFITQQKKYEQQQQNVPSIMEQTLNGFVTHVPESGSKIFAQNPYSPRSIYYVSEIIKGYKDKKSLMWEHIKTSIFLFNYFSNVRMLSNTQISKRALDLPIRPGYENKKTIIFDLDETLIHCNQNLAMGHQVELPVVFPNGQTIRAGVNIRPGAVQILQALHKRFQLMVFTASHKCYANVVIDHLDPRKQLIQHRLYRQHCYVTPKGEYVKDLRIINRQLKNIVLIDNAAYSYAFQAENGIPIIPYFSGDMDYELEMLESYLSKLQFCQDVRVANRNTFKLNRYRDYKPNQVEELVQDLYING